MSAAQIVANYNGLPSESSYSQTFERRLDAVLAFVGLLGAIAMAPTGFLTRVAAVDEHAPVRVGTPQLAEATKPGGLSLSANLLRRAAHLDRRLSFACHVPDVADGSPREHTWPDRMDTAYRV